MNRHMSRETVQTSIKAIKDDIRQKMAAGDATEETKKQGETLLEMDDSLLALTFAHMEMGVLNKLEKADTVSKYHKAEVQDRMSGYFKLHQTIELYDYLDKYAEMEYNTAVAAYILDQEVSTSAPKFNRKVGQWETEAKKEYLKPFDFFRTVLNDAELPQLMDGMRILRENFILYFLANKEDGDSALLDRKELPDSALSFRRQIGWVDYSTKTELRRQLVQCWKWMMGASAPEKAFAADVNYILSAVQKAEDRANSAGGYKESDTATLCNMVFRTAWTNLHNKAYILSRSDDFGKVESVVRNETMAEPAEKIASKTVVISAETKTGKVKTTTEPKTTAKRTTTKKKPATKPEPAKAEEKKPTETKPETK